MKGEAGDEMGWTEWKEWEEIFTSPPRRKKAQVAQ
jgi:hypothetical protein